MIPATQEFFIALSDHNEWGMAHAVWGVIEDWFVTDFVAAHDYTTHKHEVHGERGGVGTTIAAHRTAGCSDSGCCVLGDAHKNKG